MIPDLSKVSDGLIRPYKVEMNDLVYENSICQGNNDD